MQIESSIEIAAPVADVWSVLTSFSEHPSWDPFFASVEGELRPGSSLKIRLRRGVTIRPRVTRVVPGSILEWQGSAGLPGIVDGRHRFELVSLGERTLLKHSEAFSGMLLPLIGGLLRFMEQDFHAFNAALKARAERA